MRKLLAGQRNLSALGFLLVVAVVCTCIAVLVFARAQYQQAQAAVKTAKAAAASEQLLRATIIARCESRVVYDAQSQAARSAMQEFYAEQRSIEASNPFIDNKLRAKREASLNRVLDKLDHVLAATPPTNCNVYASVKDPR